MNSTPDIQLGQASGHSREPVRSSDWLGCASLEPTAAPGSSSGLVGVGGVFL